MLKYAELYSGTHVRAPPMELPGDSKKLWTFGEPPRSNKVLVELKVTSIGKRIV